MPMILSTLPVMTLPYTAVAPLRFCSPYQTSKGNPSNISERVVKAHLFGDLDTAGRVQSLLDVSVDHD